MSEQSGHQVPHEITQLSTLAGVDPESWREAAREASISIVKNMVFENSRVAHGDLTGLGHHSWVTIGSPYSPEKIIDPSLWSFDISVGYAVVPRELMNRYRPTGSGSIWNHGLPVKGEDEKEINLTHVENLSEEAENFLQQVEPLGANGWEQLLNGPMQGWPSREILTAATRTVELAHLVPEEVLGMLTDLNPGGMFLPDIGPVEDSPPISSLKAPE